VCLFIKKKEIKEEHELMLDEMSQRNGKLRNEGKEKFILGSRQGQANQRWARIHHAINQEYKENKTFEKINFVAGPVLSTHQ
jgi:hypothetical protein